MTRALSARDTLLLRVRAQRLYRLAGEGPTDVADLLRDVCSIQAQDPFAALLAIRARTDDLVATDVERARAQDRSIVRTWSMRGTLHLLATEDVGWLVPLLGPRFVRLSRRRYRELALSVAICDRAADLIHEALRSEGAMTRVEVAERLAARGVPTKGQAAYHLVRHAALRGLIALGPDRAGEPTYVALDDWAQRGEPMEREDALVELARRYVHAYGPAAPADLAAWSGLTLSDARVGFRGLSGQLAEVQMGSEPAWMLLSQAAWIGAAPPAEPVVRMLAEWDGYLLGYRNRDLALGPTFAERVHAGAGMIRPTLLVDGRVCGRWRRQRTSAGLTAALEAFEPLSTDVRTEIEAEIRDMARFLEIDVTLGTLAGG